jgi:methyl-accepting chemotaxis protein
VGEIIQATQKSFQRAAASMGAATERVSEGYILASSSGQALDDLLAAAKAMQQQTIPLVNTGAAVRNAIARLVEANEQVAQVISENISATWKIRSTTEDLTEQTRQVSASAAMLEGIARELEGALAVFQIQGKDQ